MSKSASKVWREKKENYQYLGKTGRVISMTRIIEGPKGFSGQPYWVVMVEINNSKRVVGQLVNIKPPQVGDRVKAVARRLSQPEKEEVIEYGVKWKKI